MEASQADQASKRWVCSLGIMGSMCCGPVAPTTFRPLLGRKLHTIPLKITTLLPTRGGTRTLWKMESVLYTCNFVSTEKVFIPRQVVFRRSPKLRYGVLYVPWNEDNPGSSRLHRGSLHHRSNDGKRYSDKNILH